MRADKYLGRIRRLDVRINNKLAERQRVKELATQATSNLTGMPRASGNHDKIGDVVARLITIEQELDQIIDRLVDVRAEVVSLLETLPADEYNVLHQYYVQGHTVEAISVDTDRTERQVYRIKARGLKRVQAILDAREPTELQPKATASNKVCCTPNPL